jgi:predicted metalloendopeptidase
MLGATLVPTRADLLDMASKPTAPSSVNAPARGLGSGIHLGNLDPRVRPQDDFYGYVNGTWLQATEIPADKYEVSAFSMLDDALQEALRALVEDAARAAAQPRDADVRQIGDLFSGFMDETERERQELQPLSAELTRIESLENNAAIPALVAHFNRLGIRTVYDTRVGQDARDSTRYAVAVEQSGLGLPDRDYYLQDDARLAEIRSRYCEHMQKMFVLAGVASAAADAQAVLLLETRIAHAQWTKVANRDPVRTYNKVEVGALELLTPGFDWHSYLVAADLDGRIDYVIVSQPGYLAALDSIVRETPLGTWQAYFRYHLLAAYAPYLNRAWVEEHFAFYGTVLSGIPRNRPRWKRGVALVNRCLGESLGQLYVQSHFPPANRARMLALVNNLLAAYGAGITALDWMSSATKREAQAKLARLVTKIGYPSKWRDYSRLKILRTDLVGNVMRAAALDYAYALAKLGQPIDRDEWEMTPQTINAYYDPQKNEIVFPAAILQPPFFDARADDAVNYGSIGAVIGHEISHGFDDQGSQFDAQGNLRDWFTREDHEKFGAKTAAIARQYGAYEPVPGYHINSALTLGEDIADNSGLAVAYRAYRCALGSEAAPVIDGFTGEQRFYMGWAQAWQAKVRENTAILRIKADPHSPPRFRILGTVVNQPGFYAAFAVQPGDPMYRPPHERVTIW